MFQEAEVTDATKKQDEISITTDDLVLWLGEKLVETKYQAKILTLQKNRIMELESQLLKIQSQEASSTLLITETKALNEKSLMDLKLQHEQVVNGLKTQIKELEEQLSKLQSSRHEYTISLENRLHETTIKGEYHHKEIEELKNKIKELEVENNQLKDELTKRDSGKKKK